MSDAKMMEAGELGRETLVGGETGETKRMVPRLEGEMPSAEVLKSTHKRDRGGILQGVMRFVFAVILACLGVFLGHCSFGNIEEMRQLERTPQVPVSAVVTGEINLRGGLSAYQDQVVYSTRTNTRSLYYRYTKEEERRDSDGDTQWVTVDQKSEVVDMVLSDATGGIIVRATDLGIEFDVPRSYQVREGKYRYTEYRLHEGDEVFLFGFAERGKEGYEVGFVREGTYHPVISTGTEEERRFSKALGSGFFVVGGVAALLFALLFLLKIFRVHRSIVFLMAAFMVMVTALSVQGYLMIVSDLKGADDAARRIQAEGTAVIGEILERREVVWDGELGSLGSLEDGRYGALTEQEVMRVNGVRTLMAAFVERTNYNLSRFPENVIGLGMGLRKFDPIPLPPAGEARLRELEAKHRPVKMSAWYALLGLLIGVVGTFFGTRNGIKRVALKRTIENVPTSPVAGAVYGLVELKGRVRPLSRDQVLTGPVSSQSCVAFRYKVEQFKKSGKNKSWVTISDRKEALPFVCQDGSGAMVVDPEGAELLLCQRMQRKTGNMRYTEWIMAPGEEMYVLGGTKLHPDLHNELLVAKSDDEEVPYLISNYTERELMFKKAQDGFALLNFGIVATMMAGMAITGMIFSFGPALYVATAAFTCAYLLGVLAVLFYNDLVFLRKRVDRGVANIDVALKKRFDLIQNLYEVVQGYLGHEQGLQEAIARARQNVEGSGSEALPDEEAVQASAGVRDQLLARVEAYPELKSDEMVVKFMDTLTWVEEEIALVRQGYNDAVERYNTRIYHIPEMFIAKLVGMKERRFFADAKARGAEAQIEAEW